MDKDFHYYGTYAAARIAGFSIEEATIIAHSAQYVDDSTRCSGRIMYKGENGLPIQPRPTMHDPIKELGWNVISNPWSLPDEEVRRIWMSFHFLPGNYKRDWNDPNWQSRMRDYHGPQSYNEWKYDDYAKEQFKMLCLPRSPLAERIVNEPWFSSDNYGLHRLGYPCMRTPILAPICFMQDCLHGI